MAKKTFTVIKQVAQEKNILGAFNYEDSYETAPMTLIQARKYLNMRENEYNKRSGMSNTIKPPYRFVIYSLDEYCVIAYGRHFNE